MRRDQSNPAEELAWAAGFFDAEGCFTYARSGRYALVSLGQTDREPLDRFREAVGVGHINGPYTKSGPSRPSKQPQYEFHANGWRNAQKIAELLWKDLGSLKRRQALVVMALAASHNPTYAESETLARRLNDRLAHRSQRENLAWAAGFVEGDGCFCYSRPSRSMFVSITQQDREVLDRFRRTAGFGRIYGPYRHRPGQALSVRPFYQLRVHGFEKVQAIAAMLWFKLGSVKRAQAAVVLGRWPRTCHRGHPLTTGHSGCGRCTADYWRYRRKVALSGQASRPHQLSSSPTGQ
jgi:hypothetical protein